MRKKNENERNKERMRGGRRERLLIHLRRMKERTKWKNKERNYEQNYERTNESKKY